MLNLKLIINAEERATAVLRRVTAAIDDVAARARRVPAAFAAWANNASFESVTKRIRGVGDAWDNVGRRASQMAFRIGAALGIVGYAFKTQFLDTAIMFEKYNVMMLALEKTPQKAKIALDWVSNFAMRTPLELGDVMKAFIKLRTFGMDPMNGTLQALVDMNAKLGGSAEQLQLIILGLGQAWTKGKLMGQDAMQLLNAGVPVWDLLAGRLHKTTAEVIKLSEKGALGRNVILQLIDAMEESAQGASDAMSKTWIGIMSNLSDQWTRFTKMVMDRGPFDALKTRLQDILARVNAMAANGQLDTIATKWANLFLRVITGLDRLIFGYDELYKRGVKIHVPGLFETLPTRLREIKKTMQPVVDLFGGWTRFLGIMAGAILAGPLLAAIASLILSITLLGYASTQTVAKLALWSFGPAVAAIGNFIVALRAGYGVVEAFNLVLAANPIGLVVVGLSALAGAAYLVYEHWKPIKSFFADLWEGIKTAFDKGWAYVKPIVDKMMAVAKYSPVGLALQGASAIGGYLTSAATSPRGAAAPTALSKGGLGGKAEVGGRIDIHVTSDGRAEVKKVATKNPGVELNVNAGYAMGGGL